MRLSTSYLVTFGPGADRLLLPARLILAAGEFELSRDERGGMLQALVPVERARLALRQGEASADGRKGPSTIEVPDLATDAVTISDILASLTFLSGVRMSIASRLLQDKLVADDDEDRALLVKFGTDKVHVQIRWRISMAPVSIAGIESDALEKLLARKAGLHLYAEAMHLDRPVAKYRELWRVLESAFNLQDDELVKRLSGYQPAIGLGFSHAELRRMLILRGRASHAASNAGVAELRRVNLLVGESIARLTVLATQVILTKKSWGYPTTATDPLTSLASFIGPDKALTFIVPPTGK